MRVLVLITILVAALGVGVEHTGPKAEVASPVLASTLSEQSSSRTDESVVWPTCSGAWTCGDGDIWYRNMVECNRFCTTPPCFCVQQ